MFFLRGLFRFRSNAAAVATSNTPKVTRSTPFKGQSLKVKTYIAHSPCSGPNTRCIQMLLNINISLPLLTQSFPLILGTPKLASQVKILPIRSAILRPSSERTHFSGFLYLNFKCLGRRAKGDDNVKTVRKCLSIVLFDSFN